MADIRRRTQLANRSRFALWRSYIKDTSTTRSRARGMLLASAGEVALRTPLGQWARALSECVDAGSNVSRTVGDTAPSLKHNTASTVQLSSEFGEWMPRCAAGPR